MVNTDNPITCFSFYVGFHVGQEKVGVLGLGAPSEIIGHVFILLFFRAEQDEAKILLDLIDSKDLRIWTRYVFYW